MSHSPESHMVQDCSSVGKQNMSNACGCSDEESTSPSSEGVQFKGYYPLDGCLRMYCPEEEAKKERKKQAKATCGEKVKHKCNKYCAHGINLLNRESLEIHEIKERLARRKQQHTKVERRRRELINSSIEEIAKILPPLTSTTSARTPAALSSSRPSSTSTPLEKRTPCSSRTQTKTNKHLFCILYPNSLYYPNLTGTQHPICLIRPGSTCLGLSR
ncbi:hypothetical protein DSO57_1031782 [Entomophthora muscae]|uniref:Uncharacterized protein n=1 Tax=Entomophthora muscae TaxID=34485 RepID=A0ACC2TNL6_9FUNG|nr:hypothetical protein DSO57_1031782 [Entomophthora muscae]